MALHEIPNVPLNLADSVSRRGPALEFNDDKCAEPIFREDIYASRRNLILSPLKL